MAKDTENSTSTSIKRLNEIRDFVIENSGNVEKPEYESRNYFYGGWTDREIELVADQTWETEAFVPVKIGDLIIYDPRDGRHFYRYGMVAQIFFGTVVTTREVFVAYDLGPAITLSTGGERVFSLPINQHIPTEFCKEVNSCEWVHASNETFSQVLAKLNYQIALERAKKKIVDIESLLKR